MEIGPFFACSTFLNARGVGVSATSAPINWRTWLLPKGDWLALFLAFGGQQTRMEWVCPVETGLGLEAEMAQYRHRRVSGSACVCA